MTYQYRFPSDVIRRDGPFKEFKQNGSIVTVETEDGRCFSPVLLVYPDFVGAMPDVDGIPFDPNHVARIRQTPENIKQRSSSKWTFFTKGKT